MSPFAAHLLHWEMHCKVYETGKSIEVGKSKNLDISLTLQLPIIVIIIILVFPKATIFIYPFPLQWLAYSQCICHLGHNLWHACAELWFLEQQVQLSSNVFSCGVGMEMGLGTGTGMKWEWDRAPLMTCSLSSLHICQSLHSSSNSIHAVAVRHKIFIILSFFL